MSTLSMNLYLLRNNKGKTQAEVEGDLQLGEHTWSNYEKGLRQPNADLLKDIAKYFNVSMDYLFEDHTDNKAIRDSLEKAMAVKDISSLLHNSKLWEEYKKKEKAYTEQPELCMTECEGHQIVAEDLIDDDYIDIPKLIAAYEDMLTDGNPEALRRLVSMLFCVDDYDALYESKPEDYIENMFDTIETINKMLLYCLIARDSIYNEIDRMIGEYDI